MFYFRLLLSQVVFCLFFCKEKKIKLILYKFFKKTNFNLFTFPDSFFPVADKLSKHKQ